MIERGEGVETKQIKTSYSTTAGTAYVTFDNVKVPTKHLLGEEHKGMNVILSNFNHERWTMTSTSSQIPPFPINFFANSPQTAPSASAGPSLRKPSSGATSASSLASASSNNPSSAKSQSLLPKPQSLFQDLEKLTKRPDSPR